MINETPPREDTTALVMNILTLLTLRGRQGRYSRHVANEVKPEEIMDLSYLSLSCKHSNVPYKVHHH